MPRKRKINRRRDKGGRIIPDRTPAIDTGTPELQSKRRAWLGRRAHPMERLSHSNPVDVLAAHGWLTGEQVDAARAYQHHHSIVFGPLSAAAQAIGLPRGRGITVKRRLLTQRELAAWDRDLARFSPWHRHVFRVYVLEMRVDDTVRAVVRAGVTLDLPGEDRMRVKALAGLLERFVTMRPVWVSDADVAAAEAQEAQEAAGSARGEWRRRVA